MKLPSAKDMYVLSEDAQMEVITNGIVARYWFAPSSDDWYGPAQPSPMGDQNKCFLSVNFKACDTVVAKLQALGYTVQLTDAVAPNIPDSGLLTNPQDLSGHTTISWNLSSQTPSYAFSGSYMQTVGATDYWNQNG